MTELLEKAIEKLRELPPPEQDVLAQFIASIVGTSVRQVVGKPRIS